MSKTKLNFRLINFTLVLLTLINLIYMNNSVNLLLKAILNTIFITMFIYISLLKTTKKKINTELFLIFIIALAVFYLTYSTCLIKSFLAYEAILLPSIWLVYRNSNTIRKNQITLYFTLWTQTGSFLVFLAILLIKIFIISKDYSSFLSYHLPYGSVKILVSLLCLIGLGIKLPLWPFQQWLLKTHVEATTNFSLYLSGVLIKTALIFLLKLNTFVLVTKTTPIIIILSFFGIITSSLNIFNQTDLKRLIALTTVLEMNTFLFLFFNTNLVNLEILKYFIIFHAFISTQLFLFNDFIQKRYNTRNLQTIYGLFNNTPQLAFRFILLLFLFCSFPTTIKFIMEGNFIIKISSLDKFFFIALVLLITYVSILFFFVKTIVLCYGQRYLCKTTDLSLNDKLILDFNFILMSILLFL